MKTLSVRFSKQTFLLFGFVCLATQFAGCGGTKGCLKVIDILNSYVNEASNAYYPSSCKKPCQFFDGRIDKCNVDPECLECYVGVINQYGDNPKGHSSAKTRCPTKQPPDPSDDGIPTVGSPCFKECHYLQVDLCLRGEECQSCFQYYINGFGSDGPRLAKQYCERQGLPPAPPPPHPFLPPRAIVPRGPTTPRPSASYGLPARNG
ncbi:uncharacterized protein LOC143024363 [Oratosquilla oratoria]|uniref:uncharacterized protein LOC143024363 n=1 Tax=Oratosquilla oratoria TaxID=337810 RepID=UPI003F771E6E